MAVQLLLGFASAFVAPLAIDVVLDMTGTGKATISWRMAFMEIGIVVVARPIVLAKKCGHDHCLGRQIKN